MLKSRVSVMCLVLLSTCLACPVLARKWTDTTGKFSIEAEFVGLADGIITLKREDGQTIHLPLEKLSATDQEVARALARARSEHNPFVPGGDKPVESQGASTAPDDGNTRTVLVEGVGTTAEEALKDAFRNAVRQVVGEVVDAETLVKNEELVKDQVLTYSDAFVPRHKKLSERQENGQFRVSIQATVQRRSLMQKLTTAKIAVKAVDGQSMFGNVVSQLDAEKDAGALIRKAFEGFPGNCIESKVLGEPKLLHKDAEKATLQVDLQFQANREAYRTFATRLERTLAAVASDQGDFSCTYKPDKHGRNGMFQPTKDFDGVLLMPKSAKKDRHGREKLYEWNPRRFTVALATQATPDFNRIDFKYFDLAEDLREAFMEVANAQARCKLLFVDAKDEAILEDLFPPNLEGTRSNLGGAHFREWPLTLLNPFGGDKNRGYLYPLQQIREHHLDPKYYSVRWLLIAPVFFCSTNPDMGRGTVCALQQPTPVISREVSLSLGDIKRVQQVRCELTFEKQPSREDH
jgi:hypothetical protein